jgi:pimeloyl-ACP methyl ester carboxylesterase
MLLSVDGRAVTVGDRGAGDPVVLVHSSGTSGAQWGPIVPGLAATYRVLTPDLLGYGGTAAWPDRDVFQLDADVAIVSSVIASAAAPVHLVGHSYGGLLALAATLADPASVRSLTVYEPVAFGVLAGNDAAGEADLEGAGDPGFLDPVTGGDARWMERFVDYWGGAGTWARLPSPRKDAMTATGRKTFLEVRALLADRTPAEAYAAIRCPTLIMGGTRSPAAAQGVCRVLATVIPGARREVLEGAGHMAPVEAPRRFAALLLAFLASA